VRRDCFRNRVTLTFDLLTSGTIHANRVPCTKSGVDSSSGFPVRVPTYRQTYKQTSTSVGIDLYPHMPILRPRAARYSTNGMESPTRTFIVLHELADSSDFGASGGAKFTKMGDSLPWTPTNRRAKFDAASFMLGEEIRNRTNKQACKQKHTQTVNDISTLCLSAGVDSKQTNRQTRLNALPTAGGGYASVGNERIDEQN